MPNSSDYYFEKGLNYLNEKKYDEALMYIDKAIDIDPENTGYLTNKAICLSKLELIEESIDLFDKVLKIDLDNDFAKLKKQKYYPQK